jgi:hypothetical protein
MFANRISGFYMDGERDDFVQGQKAAPAQGRPGFAPLPTFIQASGQSGPPDIYRLAYEQAREQVARRRERERHVHEWN